MINSIHKNHKGLVDQVYEFFVLFFKIQLAPKSYVEPVIIKENNVTCYFKSMWHVPYFLLVLNPQCKC